MIPWFRTISVAFVVLLIAITAVCAQEQVNNDAAAMVSPAVGGHPYPPEIRAWDQAEKERQLALGEGFIAELLAAIEGKRTELIIPKDNYRFAAASAKFGGPAQPAFIGIRGAENLTIDCSGSTFWFNDMATAIVISRNKNLVLKNLILDWDPLPFTQGTVVAVDEAANSFVFRPDPGYETFCESILSDDSPRGCLFDGQTRKLKPDQQGFSVWNFWKNKTETGDYTVKLRGFHDCKVEDVGFSPGDRFACWQRKGRAIRIELNEAVTLENITLYASPFIGYVEASGTGPTTYRRCRILKRPGTNRLIAGNADGFNSSLMKHGPIIEECEIDTIGDDFVNIHGVYARVLAQEAPDTLIIQTHGWGANEDGTADLRLYDAADYRLLGIRTATGERIQYTPEPSDLMPEKNQKWAASSNVEFGKPCPALRLKLTEPIALEAPAILCCESVVGRGAQIRKCRFTGSLARGIRFQSIDAVIEENEITWVAGPGLTLAGHPGFWGEATNSRNITIRNNLFQDLCLFKSKAPAGIQVVTAGEAGISEPLREIRINSNKIIRPGGTGIQILGADTIDVSNNTIEEYGNQESRPFKSEPATSGFGIEKRCAENVKIEGNTFRNPGTHARDEIHQE